MQWFTVAFAVMAFSAVSMARTIPNGMVYYQSAPVYYKRSVPLTHRMMYVQYVPQHANRRSATAGGVSAFASGDTIATGTYVREGEYALPDKAIEYQPQDRINEVSDEGATSIAEAYPPLNTEQSEAEYDPIDPLKVSLPEPEETAEPIPNIPEIPELPEAAPEVIEIQTKGKQPKELIPEEEIIDPEPTSADEPIEYTPATNEVETPIVAAPAPAYVPPKKKILVELEAPESTEYEDEHPYYVPHYHKKNKAGSVTTHRPVSLPPGTFFPIDFGGASGGAIAIANSFSTGEGGSASSTATAYGSPAVARSKAKKRLVQQ